MIKKKLDLRVIKRLAREAGFWINEECLITGGHDDAIIKFADLLVAELNKKIFYPVLNGINTDLEKIMDTQYVDIFNTMPVEPHHLQDACQELIRRISENMD